MGFNVISLDRDMDGKCPFGSGYDNSKNHIQTDIMTWNYKEFPKGYFHLITASPVCMWWSVLRYSWIGRKLKGMDRVLTKDDIDADIEKYGMPMVDKVFEILEYFEPNYYLIENPQTGRMKTYINDLIPYYDVDYCKYSDYGYKKTTRFWTNIPNFIPKRCNLDCNNLIEHNNQKLHRDKIGGNDLVISNGKLVRVNTKELRKKHKKDLSINYGGGSNRLDRYRIPQSLIEELFSNINLYECV